jgi:para-nitrobenzyl esterase
VTIRKGSGRSTVVDPLGSPNNHIRYKGNLNLAADVSAARRRQLWVALNITDDYAEQGATALNAAEESMNDRSPSLRDHARSCITALVFLVCTGAAWADTYNPANKQLTAPAVTIGSAIYSNMVVTVGSIVSSPTGTSANGSGDIFNPGNGHLTVPSVTVGTHTYYNAVVTLSGLISIGSVSGADSYDGTHLIIPAVQVLGGTQYTNVVITVRSIVRAGGGMPKGALDSYNAATAQLTIPAVQYGGNVYTNVTITVGMVVAVGGPGACLSNTPTIVCTQSGLVQGAVEGGYRAFRGIPYAAPPVGNLRWRPPSAPASWQGVRIATAFGNPCPQTDFNGGVTGNEDCLTLNIFGINPPASTRQPVMVFIHGGGWQLGGAMASPFDHIPVLLNSGVMLVTIQYRLGLLGFFANPLLTAEGNGSSGNYGIEDSIAALQWVHDNIARFGGDPTRVMIFGQSSGSLSVQTLLASPPAQGLFASAAMESGVSASGWSGTSLADGYLLYANFVPLVHCDTAANVLACLRALSANEVVLAQLTPGKFAYIYTSIEPRVVPVDPFNTLAQFGSPVPLLIGSNRDEDAASEDPSQALDPAGYASLVNAQFGASAGGQILALYPANFDTTPRYTHIDVQTDHDFTWETRDLARAASGVQRPPVWRYLFTHRYENDAYINSLRAFHTAELNFVAGNFQEVYYTGLPYNPTSGEITLSNEIIGYWTRLAATGNPNGAGTVTWLPYDATNEHILQLDVPIGPLPGTGYRNPQCDLLSTLP